MNNPIPPTPSPEKKLFTHVVQLPAQTDVPEFIGVYRAMFETCGVDCSQMFFPTAVKFTHPIPEMNEKLARDYAETLLILQSTVANCDTIAVINCRVTSGTATFIFEYTE